MPIMSAIESAFCRSAPWRLVARKHVLPWVLQGQALSGDVLEIGGGSGAMARGVLDYFPEVRSTVTDLDPAMVSAARRRLAGHSNASVEVADVTALPFSDASFDFATSYLMFHHVIEWPEALAELRRVLRPGGKLIGYDLTATALAAVIHRADRSPHRLVDPVEFADGLYFAGFTEVTVVPGAASHLMRFQAARAE